MTTFGWKMKGQSSDSLFIEFLPRDGFEFDPTSIDSMLVDVCDSPGDEFGDVAWRADTLFVNVVLPVQAR